MKLAVIIDVGHGDEALKLAVRAQMLLLDRLGTRLDSIRLAAPRLLDIAYASAIAEKPDVLVMMGGARSARRAGQLAYEQKIPVIFLPGLDAPQWARPLWGALSLDEMITALARNDIKRVRLSAGLAANQVFFDEARCGLLPFVPELRRGVAETDSFSEGWNSFVRVAEVSYRMVHGGLKFAIPGSRARRATALVLAAGENSPQLGNVGASQVPVFSGTAFHYGPLAYVSGLVRGSVGGPWQGGRQETFTCSEISLHVRPGSWILLDGDPLRVPGPVEFRLIRGAIESCVFALPRQSANDNIKRRPLMPYGAMGEAGGTLWNFPAPSNVAIHESRDSGEARHRRQV
jgi:hypothetical protein